ncbi:MAG: hypothetical protein ABIA37_01735 [Candidatus Woesearchaeota archaeon]
MRSRLCFYLVLFCLLWILLPAALAENQSNEITHEQAVAAINDSEQILAELINDNLPHTYVNDTVYAAKQALERADYAELLKNESLSGELVQKARKALEGLDNAGFTYTEVIKLTDQIKGRKDQTYLLVDTFTALELQLASHPEIDQTEIMALLTQAKTSFDEERLQEADEFIFQAHNLLDEQLSENTQLKIVVENGKTVLRKFWMVLVTLLVSILLSGLLLQKRFKRRKIIKNCQRMKIEREILTDLVKEAQRKRFEEGSIPDYLYNIKIKKYKERLAKIKAELPLMKKTFGK